MLELIGVDVVHHQGRANQVISLRDLTLTIEDGEFVTVAGANGAGKSTLLQVVSGAVRPTSGRLLLDGRDLTRQPEHARAAYMARVFDNPTVGTVASLSIEENLALAMRRGMGRGLRLAVTGRRRDQMRDRLARLGLGLEHRLKDPVGLLSAGQRQSLTLVMSAMRRPQVLLLDEHLSALDPRTQRRVYDLTVDLVRDVGCTTLMITHDLGHARAAGSRTIVLSRGRLRLDVRDDARRRLSEDDLLRAISDD